jgi:hypothetical protein
MNRISLFVDSVLITLCFVWWAWLPSCVVVGLGLARRRPESVDGTRRRCLGWPFILVLPFACMALGLAFATSGGRSSEARGIYTFLGSAVAVHLGLAINAVVRAPRDRLVEGLLDFGSLGFTFVGASIGVLMIWPQPF